MRFLLLILTFISISLSAAEIKGKVVGVSDGDTITVLDDMDKGRFRVRLDKIDAPEKNQAFGSKAKQVLSSLIYGKNVVVRFNKIDNYGRVLGVVFLGEKEINLIMVQDGYARHYSYYDKTQSYIDAEKKARADKKGLWIDPNPMNPYEFRKTQKRR
jgi:endonuclease YncB( thermonuclease family)